MLIKNIIRFVVLVLFQVLMLNSLNFGGWAYPAFYIYFILLLPFETTGWMLLLSSFFIGLSVDFFTNSLGMNAAASVFMAFCRPSILGLLRSKREYELGFSPGIKDLGFGWFLSYAYILILIHHTVLFSLEVFSFSGILQTILRIVLSSIVTLLLAILAQVLFYKTSKV
jgi:rod shape-determining protein MreD